ncbi:MAG: hypothetical protein D5R99_05055 [Methanocalculus sp. MSAO_Arc1]|nr:MAG: hypothetical protein D5R99_05055 [Methanocalculus sp. MSAO_Arc1]
MSGSILVILVFHGLISHTGPDFFSTPYDPELSDGVFVSFEGEVLDIRHTRTGGHRIVDVSGTKLFIPRGIDPPEFRIGDQIAVYGITTTFHGEKEIIIQKSADIILL